jgi:hypothetical protein
MIPEVTPDMPLGLARKIRDRMEKDFLFYCDETNPDDDLTRWLGQMIHWSTSGPNAYADLRLSFFKSESDGLLEPLRRFREACMIVHNLELKAATTGTLS